MFINRWMDKDVRSILIYMYVLYVYILGCPAGAGGKESTCQYMRHRRHRFYPWVGKIPWKKTWQPTPVFLPGESHGQRSLVGYSAKGAKSRIQLKWLSPPTYIFMHTHTYTNGILPSNIKEWNNPYDLGQCFLNYNVYMYHWESC